MVFLKKFTDPGIIFYDFFDGHVQKILHFASPFVSIVVKWAIKSLDVGQKGLFWEGGSRTQERAPEGASGREGEGGGKLDPHSVIPEISTKSKLSGIQHLNTTKALTQGSAEENFHLGGRRGSYKNVIFHHRATEITEIFKVWEMAQLPQKRCFFHHPFVTHYRNVTHWRHGERRRRASGWVKAHLP